MKLDTLTSRPSKRLPATRIGLAFLLLISPSLHALEFQCELNGDVRYLRMDIPGEDNLCEMSVEYANTGERKVMWYAKNDSMFCSVKANELANKYQNTWGFACSLWPDRDGVDQLTPRQRSILDIQLKQLIAQGQEATPPFSVTALRAEVSTLSDKQSGNLAIQFFLSNGRDLTRIINLSASKWELFSTIDDLASHITGDSSANIESALISSVSDGGALEIATSMVNDDERTCHGKQVLMVGINDQLTPRTEHLVVCQPAIVSSTLD